MEILIKYVRFSRVESRAFNCGLPLLVFGISSFDIVPIAKPFLSSAMIFFLEVDA
jgi:hypothetical protein